MKSYFLKVVSALFFVFAAAGVVACGDDSDGDGGSSGSSKVPAPYLTDSNGNRIQVLSIGSGTEKSFYPHITFTYDEKGKLTGIKHGTRVITILSPDFIMSYSEHKAEVETKINTNSSGLITSMESNAIGYDSLKKETVRETYTCTYKYNSNKQLTNASIVGKEMSGDKINSNILCMWSGGNLLSMVIEEKQVDGETGKAKDRKHTYTYTYGENINTFKQMPGAIRLAFNEGLWGDVCALGLFGVGPANLPISYTVDSGRSYSLSYTFNVDGSIKTEKGSEYLGFTYMYK